MSDKRGIDLERAVTFDPWTASVEDAIQAQSEVAEPLGPEAPIFRCAAARQLEAALEHSDRASGFDVLHWVSLCAWHGLVMPDWLARAFLRRYRAVQLCLVDSWDAKEAFGRPYKKGAQIAAMRRRRLNRVAIANAVTTFVEMHPDKPLDPEWEAIGKKVGESPKNAQKLLAEAIEMGLAFRPSDIRKRLGWPSVPSKSRKLSGRHQVRRRVK